MIGWFKSFGRVAGALLFVAWLNGAAWMVLLFLVAPEFLPYVVLWDAAVFAIALALAHRCDCSSL